MVVKLTVGLEDGLNKAHEVLLFVLHLGHGETSSCELQVDVRHQEGILRVVCMYVCIHVCMRARQLGRDVAGATYEPMSCHVMTCHVCTRVETQMHTCTPQNRTGCNMCAHAMLK
jgi:hypothetical protein